MPLNADKLLSLKIPPVEHRYGAKDCILYALGLGYGRDPLNADELAFVYEQNLKALPTYALVQAYSPYWLREADVGITWTHVVHGEQGLVLHAPVAPQGPILVPVPVPPQSLQLGHQQARRGPGDGRQPVDLRAGQPQAESGQHPFPPAAGPTRARRVKIP